MKTRNRIALVLLIATLAGIPSTSFARYVQPDPIGQLKNTQGLLPLDGKLNHLYGYVDQNPINKIDPNGLNPAVIRAIQILVNGARLCVRTPAACMPFAQPVPSAPQRAEDINGRDPLASELPPYWPNQYAESDDDVLPFPNTNHKPWWDDEDKCEEDKDKGCEALRQSILNTCASLTGMKKMRCFQEANALYLQCLEDK